MRARCRSAPATGIDGYRLHGRGGIASITINNPERANVLDHATSKEFAEAWRNAWEDRAVRVAVITGSGERHICAGHNLAPWPGVTPEESEYLRTQRIFWPRAGTVNGTPTGVDGHYPQIWKPRHPVRERRGGGRRPLPRARLDGGLRRRGDPFEEFTPEQWEHVDGIREGGDY